MCYFFNFSTKTGKYFTLFRNKLRNFRFKWSLYYLDFRSWIFVLHSEVDLDSDYSDEFIDFTTLSFRRVAKAFKRGVLNTK